MGFFQRPEINPLRASLQAFPPLLVIGGSRDFYVSDGYALTLKACAEGVRVKSFLVAGGFHDFIEYSTRCPPHLHAPMPEVVEAYRQIRIFVHEESMPKTPFSFCIGQVCLLLCALFVCGSIVARIYKRHRTASNSKLLADYVQMP